MYVSHVFFDNSSYFENFYKVSFSTQYTEIANFIVYNAYNL